MNNKGIEEYPQPDARDRLQAVVAALVSPVPYAEPIITALVKAPLDRRRELWLLSLSDAILELQKKYENLTTDYLTSNPAFITAVLSATTIAIRNHQEEKLQALRNVVLNSALPNAPDDDTQQMFLQMLDTFTTWHLRLLKFFADPDWYVQLGYPSTLDDLPAEEALTKLEIIFPELKERKIFANRVVNDLSDHRLVALPEIRIDKREMLWALEKVSPTVISELGEQFLQFVASPLDE